MALTAGIIALSVALFDGYDWGVHALSALGHVDVAEAAASRRVYTAGLLVTTPLGLVFAVGTTRLEDYRLWSFESALYAIVPTPARPVVTPTPPGVTDVAFRGLRFSAHPARTTHVF